jgi:hypothetical protein
MKIEDLIKKSTGLLPNEAAITIGTSNRIIISKAIALEKLQYQDNDEFFIDSVVDNGISGIIIGCMPKIDDIKTFPFNTTGTTFSNKTVADYLGGEKSQWNIDIKYDDLELDNRLIPLFLIKQTIKGEEVKKEQNETYTSIKKAEFEKVKAADEPTELSEIESNFTTDFEDNFEEQEEVNNPFK